MRLPSRADAALQQRAPPPLLAGPLGARRAAATPSQLRGTSRRTLRRHPSSAPHAALYQLPSDLGDALRTAAGVSCMLALTLSAMPILTGEAKERNERPLFAPGSSEDFAGGVKWGVMAVLSCIPLLNPLVTTRCAQPGWLATCIAGGMAGCMSGCLPGWLAPALPWLATCPAGCLPGCPAACSGPLPPPPAAAAAGGAILTAAPCIHVDGVY